MTMRDSPYFKLGPKKTAGSDAATDADALLAGQGWRVVSRGGKMLLFYLDGAQGGGEKHFEIDEQEFSDLRDGIENLNSIIAKKGL